MNRIGGHAKLGQQAVKLVKKIRRKHCGNVAIRIALLESTRPTKKSLVESSFAKTLCA